MQVPRRFRARHYEKSFLLPLLALTFLASGCSFLGESAPATQPTPDWQPTREALIQQREELKERAIAREARLESMVEVAGIEVAPVARTAADVAPVPGPPALTVTQIFAKLDRGDITSEEARKLLEELRTGPRRNGELSEEGKE